MYEDEYKALLAENEQLRNQLASSIPAPAYDSPLASEKNFRMLTGVDEIPKRYGAIFDSLLAASTQWMYIKSAGEEDDWVDRAAHHIKTWKFENPYSGITISDEQEILIYFRRYINRSYMGFERNGIISTIQTVNYQSQPIAPQTSPSKKLGLLERLIPHRR